MDENVDENDEHTSWSVTGDAELQDTVLEQLSTAVNYRRWICTLASPWLGDEPIELGSGNGDYAAQWAHDGARITASEAQASRVGALDTRFAAEPLVSVRHVTLPDTAVGGYSAAVAINVLEHIEADVEAIAGMGSLVRSGGHVVLFVPAFGFAMSSFDRQVGHWRRYRRRELTDKLRLAGLEPRTVHYVNAPGLLAWLVMMRLLRGRPQDGFAVRTFDRLVPTLQRIEARRHPPFGQSLFAVARRP